MKFGMLSALIESRKPCSPGACELATATITSRLTATLRSTAVVEDASAGASESLEA
jgi:hypothetical protein